MTAGLIVAAAAIVHSRTRRLWALGILWLATLLLFGLAFLTIFGVGLVFAPGYSAGSHRRGSRNGGHGS